MLSKNLYRSGLEERQAELLTREGIPFAYEKMCIHYTKPERQARYIVDFVLKKSGIIIETKGRFLTNDRQKHLLIRAQHPEYDIRFVFSRSSDRLSKKSKTTYAMWCEKHRFKYADKVIPAEWLG
jgi:hypothetical protein